MILPTHSIIKGMISVNILAETAKMLGSILIIILMIGKIYSLIVDSKIVSLITPTNVSFIIDNGDTMSMDLKFY